MGGLDARHTLPSATNAAFSGRKFQSRGRPGAAATESSRCLLHDSVSAAVLGFLCFRFRTRVFIPLVCKGLWIVTGDKLAFPPTGNTQPRADSARYAVDFSCAAMVVLFASGDTGSHGNLGDLHLLRH